MLRCFKAEWKKRWYDKRNELVQSEGYTTTERPRNPEKHFLLDLVKEFVDDLNGRSYNGISIARQSLMMCGLIQGIDGNWAVDHLTSKLREIVEENLT